MPVLALPVWQARGPRFLLLLLGLWILVRLASHWPGDVGAAPPVPFPLAAPPELAAKAPMPSPREVASPQRLQQGAEVVTRSERAWAPRMWPASVQAMPRPSGFSGNDRHGWRLALLRRYAASPGRAPMMLALPRSGGSFAPGLAPLNPLPRWPDAAPGRWSLAVASYWRPGSTTAAVGPGSAVRLGGSQSAARIDYLVDERLALRAYARATHTPGRRDGFDVAVGIALRPVASVPVDVHIERRAVVAGGGRNTTLLYVAGGVDDRVLPHDFRLSAYAQGGAADYGRIVGFADGLVSVQREVAALRGMRLSLGTMVAAAVQPDARRVDVGPRATVLLPDVGNGARIAVDWRERVAGNAQPGSGVALTLATDF